MINGFTVHKNGLLRIMAGIPTEDAFATFEDGRYRMMSAADGVTRDCTNGKPLTRDWKGLLNAMVFYPRHPDSAQVAATLFSDASLNGIKFSVQLGESVARFVSGDAARVDEATVKYGFARGNETIRAWQRINIPHVDYLVNDFPGCVAALGLVDLKQGEFYWGQICDAGAALLDKEGNLVMKTENDGPDKHDRYIWATEEMKGLGWTDARARVNVRSIFRNNPRDPVHGEHTFGVLTGEDEAMEYVRTGVQEFKPGYVAMVYTDGLERVMFEGGDIRGNVADAVRDRNWGDFRRICKKGVRTEGTVIYTANDEN